MHSLLLSRRYDTDLDTDFTFDVNFISAGEQRMQQCSCFLHVLCDTLPALPTCPLACPLFPALPAANVHYLTGRTFSGWVREAGLQAGEQIRMKKEGGRVLIQRVPADRKVNSGVIGAGDKPVHLMPIHLPLVVSL